MSVLRGDRCGYRAQIGLDGAARDRRRETTFCTHTVSGGGPMVVPDAAREPFFRGSPMVLRDGIRAYVGVPLRTSRGIVIGTVCAMDFVPRRIGPEVVRTLERYAEPLVAEIERARTVRRAPPPAGPAPPPALHPAPGSRSSRARPRWRAPLADRRPAPRCWPISPTPATSRRGRLSGDAVGLLLAGTGASSPAERCSPTSSRERLAQIQAALGPGIAAVRLGGAEALANYFR